MAFESEKKQKSPRHADEHSSFLQAGDGGKSMMPPAFQLKAGSANDSPAQMKKDDGGGGWGVMDWIHTGLDVVGLIPGFGEAADLVNAGAYLVEGDYGNAALSAASAIPLAGYGATAAKWGKKGANIVDAVSDSSKAVDRGASAIKSGASSIEKAPHTPVGRSGNPLNVVTKNAPKTIDGTKFTGHALDQMQSRGILSPSAVLDVVKNPSKKIPGNETGTWVYIRDNLKVVTNNSGDIMTVIPQ